MIEFDFGGRGANVPPIEGQLTVFDELDHQALEPPPATLAKARKGNEAQLSLFDELTLLAS